MTDDDYRGTVRAEGELQDVTKLQVRVDDELRKIVRAHQRTGGELEEIFTEEVLDNAIHYWPILTREGDTVTDDIGTVDGTISGTIERASGEWVGGSALDSSGDGNQVEMDSWTQVFENLTTDFAVLATVRVEAGEDSGHFVDPIEGTSDNIVFEPMGVGGFGDSTAGSFWVRIEDPSGNDNRLYTDQFDINDGNRHRIVFNKRTNDIDNWEVWIDGQQRSVEITEQSTLTDTGDLSNGMGFFSADNPVAGELDEVIVTEQCLSSRAIREDYDRQPWNLPDSVAADIAARYDAFQLDNEDGEELSTWPDEAGSADFDDEGDPSQQSPTYRFDGINNYPAVDMTDSSLYSTEATRVTHPWTLFLVVLIGDATPDRLYLLDGTDSGGDVENPDGARMSFEWRHPDGDGSMRMWSGSTGFGNSDYDGLQTPYDEAIIFSGVQDSSGAFLRTQRRYGNQDDNSPGNQDWDIASMMTDRNNDGPPWDVTVGELLVVDTALPFEDVLDVEKSLTYKWGIDVEEVDEQPAPRYE